MEAIEQMTKFLAAGINVVGTSMVWLVTPRHADDWLRDAIGACLRGRQHLALRQRHRPRLLRRYAGALGGQPDHPRSHSITVQEIFDYGNYDDAEFTGAAMGFRTTADDDSPMMFLPGVIVSMWGGQVRSLADHLDIKLDDVRQRVEPWYTPERIECTMMTVEPGQMAAVRFATEGVRDSKPVITLEHVTRLTRPRRRTGSFRPTDIPAYTVSSWRANHGWKSTRTSLTRCFDSTDAGCISTAGRVVNAIDWVCRAPQGLIGVEDIPLSAMMRGLMWAEQ